MGAVSYTRFCHSTFSSTSHTQMKIITSPFAAPSVSRWRGWRAGLARHTRASPRWGWCSRAWSPWQRPWCAWTGSSAVTSRQLPRVPWDRTERNWPTPRHPLSFSAVTWSDQWHYSRLVTRLALPAPRRSFRENLPTNLGSCLVVIDSRLNTSSDGVSSAEVRCAAAATVSSRLVRRSIFRGEFVNKVQMSSINRLATSGVGRCMFW